MAGESEGRAGVAYASYAWHLFTAGDALCGWDCLAPLLRANWQHGRALFSPELRGFQGECRSLVLCFLAVHSFRPPRPPSGVDGWSWGRRMSVSSRLSLFCSLSVECVCWEPYPSQSVFGARQHITWSRLLADFESSKILVARPGPVLPLFALDPCILAGAHFF